MFQSLAPTLLILPLLLLSYIRVGYQTQKFCKHCVLGILLSNFGVQQFGTQIWRIPFMWKIPSRLSIYLENWYSKCCCWTKQHLKGFRSNSKELHTFCKKNPSEIKSLQTILYAERNFLPTNVILDEELSAIKKLAIILQPDYHV